MGVVTQPEVINSALISIIVIKIYHTTMNVATKKKNAIISWLVEGQIRYKGKKSLAEKGYH